MAVPSATWRNSRFNTLDRSRIELSLRRFWPNLCEGQKRLREAVRPSETVCSVGSTELLFGLAAALCVLAKTSPLLAMEDCHGPVSEPFGKERGELESSPTYGMRVSTVVASYQSARYQGDYEGLGLGFDARFRRLQLGVTLPAYRLVRNGAVEVGLGDVVALSSVTMTDSYQGALAFGAVLGVSLPTGSAANDLGMGHVMAMPAFWLSSELDWLSTRFTLGYGIAMATEAGGHDHGDVPAPIVAPMNVSELEASLANVVRLGRYFEGLAGIFGAAPVAMSDGIVRASAYAGLGVRSKAGFSARIEAHAPLAGDPFVAKGRLVVTYGF
jgi:hypothetical protein